MSKCTGERCTMNDEFEECLKRRRLVKFPQAKTFVQRELREARNDLGTAKSTLSAGNHKWATIQAYFSMFHCARSLIYQKGYREKSHFCLIAALRAIYLDNGLLGHKSIEDIQLGKRMREGADYHADFSVEAAKALIESAEDFLSLAHSLIEID